MNIERETDNIIRTGQLHAYEWRDTGVTSIRKNWMRGSTKMKQQERLRLSIRTGKSYVQTRFVAI